MKEITWVALIPNKNSTYPDMEAVNGGQFEKDYPELYNVVLSGKVYTFRLGVDLFESPEEALEAVIAIVQEKVDQAITSAIESCRHMRLAGEHLHDPHLAETTIYNSELLAASGLPSFFGEVASTLIRYEIQYAHLLEVLGDA